MKIDVRKIYPNIRYEWCDYQPMLDAFGKIVIQVKDDDYSGDTRILYEKNGIFGHLIFGWGSCSGCDALQACGSYAELQELCDRLQESIIWFEDIDTAIKWFKNHDWEGDFSWHDKNTNLYVEKALKFLTELQ